MLLKHRHEFPLDQVDNAAKDRCVANGVVVQPMNQPLSRMLSDFRGQRNFVHNIVGILCQLQRTLIHKLSHDAVPNLRYRSLSVDHAVVKLGLGL